ncbi:uncharacterized protein [Nicotiana tomentosiformis]|uniref:uncharacterized protein n=1 Tax=Nicotiana tomentosiformis TaxID=4098 RepID=UPI00388CBB17
MEGVELASYHLKGVSYSWFELWEESREEGSPPARWGKFTNAFMDHFLPAETKEARVAEFESLKQGSMNGLSPLVINEASTAALNSDINYGKIVAFAQATETRKLKNRMEHQSSSKARSAGNFGGSSNGSGRSAFRGASSGPSQLFAQSSMGAQSSGPRQGNRGPHQ